MTLLAPIMAATPISPNLFADAGGMLSNEFMRYAFIAGTSTALLSGLVGYFVVLRSLAFAGEALSHVAFAAALGGVLLGIEPLAGMFVITVAVAAGMGPLVDSARSADVAVGTVLAWVLGLGALFLSIYTSSAHAGSNGQIGISILFGSIFGVQLSQVQGSVIVGVPAVLLLLAVARPLLFASIDATVAVARGVPVRVLSALFLVVLAITVAESVQVVGALLVLSLLVLPAATAQRLTARPFPALLLSALLAVAFTWAGLVLGYYTPYPVSFLITTLAFVAYAGTAGSQYLRLRWRNASPRGVATE